MSPLVASRLMMFSRMPMKPLRKWVNRSRMVLVSPVVLVRRGRRQVALAPQRMVIAVRVSLVSRVHLVKVPPVRPVRVVQAKMVPMRLTVRMAVMVFPELLIPVRPARLRLRRLVLPELVLLAQVRVVPHTFLGNSLEFSPAFSLAHNPVRSLVLRQFLPIRPTAWMVRVPVPTVLMDRPLRANWPPLMEKMELLVRRLYPKAAQVLHCLMHIPGMRRLAAGWRRWRLSRAAPVGQLVLQVVFPVQPVRRVLILVRTVGRSLSAERMDRRLPEARLTVKSRLVLLRVRPRLAVLPPEALRPELLVRLVRIILLQLRRPHMDRNLFPVYPDKVLCKDRRQTAVFPVRVRLKVRFLGRVLLVRLAVDVSPALVRLAPHVMVVSLRRLLWLVPLFKELWLPTVRRRVRLAELVSLPQVLALVNRLLLALVLWLLNKVLVRLAPLVLRLSAIAVPTVWGRPLLWVRLCPVVRRLFPVAERPVCRVVAEPPCLLKADRALVLPRLNGVMPTVLSSKARLRLRLRMSLVSCRRQVRMVLFLRMNLVWPRNRRLVLLLLVRTVNGRSQQRERHMPVRLMLFVLPVMAARL